MPLCGTAIFASSAVAVSAVIFYYFTGFTIDTSLLWALIAHYRKAFSGVHRRCGCMIPTRRFREFLYPYLGCVHGWLVQVHHEDKDGMMCLCGWVLG